MSGFWQTVLSVVDRLTNFFVGPIPHGKLDNLEEISDRRLLVGVLLCLGFVGGMASFFSIFFETTASPLEFDPFLLMPVSSILGLVLLRLGFSTKPVVLLLIFVLLVRVFWDTCRLGTPFVPSTFRLFIVIVVAAALFGQRIGVFSTLASIAVVAVAAADPFHRFDVGKFVELVQSPASVLKFAAAALALLLFGLYLSYGRKKIQEMREQYFAQTFASARSNALSSFIQGVNHELNNPLAILLMSIEELQVLSKDESRADIQQSIERIQSSAHRIGNVVQLLNRYSGLRVESEFKRFSLSDVVSEAASVLGGYYAFQGISFEILENCPDSNIMGERKNVESILTSLLSNSRDAILTRGNGKISLRVSRVDDWVVLSVYDTGVGISKDNLPRIWDPFFTTKSPSRGMGMGLAVVDTLVKQMGGAVLVQSEAGVFTEVTLRFPAAAKPV